MSKINMAIVNSHFKYEIKLQLLHITNIGLLTRLHSWVKIFINEIPTLNKYNIINLL